MRFKFLNKVAPQNRILYRAERIADEVIAYEPNVANQSELALKNRVDEIIAALANDELIDHYLVEILAIIREILFRTYGMKAYRVQLIGAIIVHFGDFAEMMTGEGKTLTLVLAAFVNALYKKGVHIVTVNEYLVQRDAEFAAGALNRLGISCGYITAAMDSDTKRSQYACDVTYVPNSELGFDYLRDNMVERYEDKVQRGLYFAIVDEADSVLIDEARTPLIIAGQPNDDLGDYVRADRFVKGLDANDYIVDHESNSINLSEYGVEKAQAFFGVKNIYDFEFSDIVHKINNSLRANKIFANGVEYIVRKKKDDPQKEEIVLVDQFTGRIMDGRSYSAGLQQAIQAKEYVEIEPENLTVATITYQSLFRMYQKLSGVSGTAYTESEEILNIYNMVVVRIPTNRPVVRIDQPDYIFESKKTKWKYVVAEIKKRHKTGQPILVGTASVDDSEVLHLLLQRLGIPHTVLNAKNNAMEAEIIKDAGQKGRVTIATYMAGRGTDIKLGEGVRELGGLYVIGTERNESRRVDNQLRGRAGRQGDPGESRFFISLQDSLFKRFATNKLGKADTKMDENSVTDTRFFTRLLNNTQKKVEGINYDMRKSLIDYDYVLSAQRELFYKQRDKILLSEDLNPIIFRMMTYVVDDAIQQNIDEVNRDTIHIDELIDQLNTNLFGEPYLTDPAQYSRQIDTLNAELLAKMRDFILQKEAEATPRIFQLQIKQAIIHAMDNGWTQHLDLVGKLKDSVNLRAYEQKSPLNIYVGDADKLFHKMVKNIAFFVIRTIAQLNTTLIQRSTVNPFEIPEAPGEKLLATGEGVVESGQAVATGDIAAAQTVTPTVSHPEPHVELQPEILVTADARFWERLNRNAGAVVPLENTVVNVHLGGADHLFAGGETVPPSPPPAAPSNLVVHPKDAAWEAFLTRILRGTNHLVFLGSRVENVHLGEAPLFGGEPTPTFTHWLGRGEDVVWKQLPQTGAYRRFGATYRARPVSTLPTRGLDVPMANFLHRIARGSQVSRPLTTSVTDVRVGDAALFTAKPESTPRVAADGNQVPPPGILGPLGPGPVTRISHLQDAPEHQFLARIARNAGAQPPRETVIPNIRLGTNMPASVVPVHSYTAGTAIFDGNETRFLKRMSQAGTTPPLTQTIPNIHLQEGDKQFA